MGKLINTVVLGVVIFLCAQWLYATTYPKGAAGIHPVSLSSDVTGTLPHASTSNDAANVHGLGASVNVLGNLDASGEFIQRTTTNPATGDAGAGSRYSGNNNTLTYGTAFSSTPFVMFAGSTDTELQCACYIFSVGTTTASYRIDSVNANDDSDQARWVILGS